jgi:hypothetical protein
MLSTLKFIVLEDKVSDQKEILNQLAQAGLSPEGKLGVATTYNECKELLEKLAQDLDVVFLDLNIPRSDKDPRPEDRHGKGILDIIHSDFNRRPGVHIRVIVISGQELANSDVGQDLLMRQYDGTLIGIVQKAGLPALLNDTLSKLHKDPLRVELQRLRLHLTDQLDCVRDTSKPIKERLKAAREIGIRIGLNELDYRDGRVNSHPNLEDDLNGILKELERRFLVPGPGRRVQIGIATIQTDGGWGSFIWRGALIQHLYILNSYRNIFEHLREQPYDNPSDDPDEWNIPADIMQRAQDGAVVGQIVELFVSDLLHWYLPWHEQVYLPRLEG